METMRDAFFNRLYDFAKNDPAIMVLASDFSAPAFDQYRTELPEQFVNTGISEQNTILAAAGLAMSGMRVFVVSIAPFITMRCFEQIRLYPADMNLNVTIVGVGAGFSYSEAGATHHAVEDIGLMSMLPHMTVFSPSGNAQTRHFVEDIIRRGGPHYVRLDRRSLPELHGGGGAFALSLQPIGPLGKSNFVATGSMVHVALAMAEELRGEGITVGVVDAQRLPLDAGEFRALFADTGLIVSLEEHVAAGGLGAAVRSRLDDSGLPVKLRVFALDLAGGLCHDYGPREIMRARHGLDPEVIKAFVRKNHG